MKSPLRVLQVIDTFGMGGAETWLIELLRYWAPLGSVQLEFLATSGSRGMFDDEATQLGARVHYLKYGRLHIFGFASGFRRLLEAGRFDAIHDHQDYASGWHFFLGAGVLPPVRVTHVHNPKLHLHANYAISSSRKVVANVGHQLVRRFATHVCGTSAQALHEYGFDGGSCRQSVSVLHCGFDQERFQSTRAHCRKLVISEFALPGEAKIALFAGRLDRDLEIGHPRNHKNSWFAVEVARIACRLDPKFFLLMAGSGELQRARMNERILEWGLAYRLQIIGVRRDIGVLLRAADVLFFPSTEEGLGMVAVEAQSAATPVLASDQVPREAVVIPEIYTALSLDTPLERWARRLIELAEAPRRDDAYCRTAFEASAFSIKRSAGELEAMYGCGRRCAC